MSNRYFVDAEIAAAHVTLAGPEAHHLLHVMRGKPGDRVLLFDGSGRECPAIVDRCGRSEVELRVIECRAVDRELPFALEIGVALPKGDRQKWLVEKLVELGVTRLIPLATARGVAQPTDHALERLRRAVVEASKQCGRNRLMAVDEPWPWPQFVAAPVSAGAARLVLHPGGEAAAKAAATVAAADAVTAAIGPEGGWTDDEAQAAVAAGWMTIDLGPRILRVETAAAALAAMIVAWRA